ncbi:protein KIBRA-like [Paramacrobiotus metropolitanus]|uniref:protein KIBRA-like n=1 Tax=Paramacrobiotus metropolitanus TaxID=2943436 RepID=UPI0024462A1B|nr:protein KIBRA-like [Paramacrobiotus metropolitanus]
MSSQQLDKCPGEQEHRQDTMPAGWSVGRDVDGKPFYIDHVNKITTWIDPRERQVKPQSFSECTGDELPAGWERAFHPQLGVYYIDHNTKANHFDDPRAKYRSMQKEMLQDYLRTAQNDLEAKREIYGIKQQRLQIAQDDFVHLNNTLRHLGGSKQSLCSTISSGGTRYDVELLRADIMSAKSRVERLKRELRQIQTEVQIKERGLSSLAQVEQKFQENPGGTAYSIEEAQAVLSELKRIQYSLLCGEQQKQDLIASLAQLKDEILLARDIQTSPDLSYLHLPQERMSAASQTDVTGDLGVSSGVRIAELARRRLEYDETRKQVSELQHRLAQIQKQASTSDIEADYDRVVLIQEKEHLLREMCSIHPTGRSTDGITRIQQDINILKRDLRSSSDLANRSLAMRFRLREERDNLVLRLRDVMRRQASLESELRSLSTSTLSISSASSRGSLSGSTVSTGSLGSTGSLDLLRPAVLPAVNMLDLQKRVERLLSQSSSLQSFDEFFEETQKMQPQYRIAGHHLDAGASRPVCQSTQCIVCNGYEWLPHDRQMLEQNNRPVQFTNGAPLSTPTAGFALHERCHLCTTKPPLQPNVDDMGYQSYGQSHCFNVREHTPRYENYLPSSGNDLYDPPITRPNEPALSPICEMGNSESAPTPFDSQFRNRSSESVTGDSGVYEGTSVLTEMRTERISTTQLLIRLWYGKRDGILNIGLEKLTNIFALDPPSNSQIGIRVSVLPPDGSSCDAFASKQHPLAGNLGFVEVFQCPLRPNVLPTKTLDVSVWATQIPSGAAECLGNSLIGLAEYSEISSLTKWFSVVKTDRQPDKLSLSRDLQLLKIRDTETSFISSLLASSSLSTARVECDAEDHLDGGKTDSDCNSVIIREESSDESTLACSSQASTLTRGQRPGVYDVFDEEHEVSSEEDEITSQIPADSHSSSDLSVLGHPSSSLAAESGYGHSGDALGELCDKETNTESGASVLGGWSVGGKSNGAALRRSHTLNIRAEAHQTGIYNCRLNRSDSDSCVPCQKSGDDSFARNTLERRSLRWKRPTKNGSSLSAHSSTHRPVAVKTALEWELSLKASQIKLQNLNEEVSRLRNLAEKLIQVKNSSENELPDWFADLEKDLDTACPQKFETSGPGTPRTSKVNRMLRKTLKEIQKFQRTRGHSEDLTDFRKTMASFLDTGHRVPLSDALYHPHDAPPSEGQQTSVAEKVIPHPKHRPNILIPNIGHCPPAHSRSQWLRPKPPRTQWTPWRRLTRPCGPNSLIISPTKFASLLRRNSLPKIGKAWKCS